MLNVKTGALIATLSILGACAPGDPRSYESTPVKVETAKGTVTCQLYTRERVLWDRAIDRPNGMTIEAADAVCMEEGRRWQAS